MSHLIQELDNVLLGSRKPAWHKLGTVVDGQPCSADALRLAKLDWRVECEPVCLPDGIGGFIEVPDSFVTVRTDLARTDVRRAMGVVGRRYEPIQNIDDFRIGDEIAGTANARWETAGSLKNGREIFATMVMPDAIKIVDDTIQPYILITSAHDGSRAQQILFTPVRVVCANTLASALYGAGKGANKCWTIRHTANAKERQAQAIEAIKRGTIYFEAHAASMRSMAAAKIDDRFASAFVQALFPDPPKDSARNGMANKRSDVLRLYKYTQAGANQAATRGTAYGLFNALAEYTDHSRTTRACNGTSENEARFTSSVFGSGAALKQSAYGLLTRVLDLPGANAAAKDSTIDALMDSWDLSGDSKSPSVDDVLGQIAFN